jgi:hypothetical protein
MGFSSLPAACYRGGDRIKTLAVRKLGAMTGTTGRATALSRRIAFLDIAPGQGAEAVLVSWLADECGIHQVASDSTSGAEAK